MSRGKYIETGVKDMLKAGAQQLSGLEEAVIGNIESCKKLATLARTSLGPNGMNKMVINHLDKLFVTNDAATIVNELEVVHPAAKMLVMASQQQEKEMGDNTNLVIVFAGQLLLMAGDLIRMGLHPADIVAGYEQASVKCQEILENLIVENAGDLRKIEAAKTYIKPAIMSKQWDYCDLITDLIAKACVMVAPEKLVNFNSESVRSVKLTGASILDSACVNGLVVTRGCETSVHHLKNVKVAVISCPIASSQTETKGTVLLTNADQLTNFAKGEEAEIEKTIKDIYDAGARCIVAGNSISDLAIHFMERYKILCVKVLSKFELRRLAKTVGAVPLARLGAPTPEEMGYCDEIVQEELSANVVTIFRQNSEESRIATIVLRGPTKNILDDLERAVDDGVNTYKALCKDGRVLAGAGACEMECSRRLTQVGEVATGLEQYAIQKYALALQVVPNTLAENCGMSIMDGNALLLAAHEAGELYAGIDVENQSKLDAKSLKIFDAYSVKSNALRLATDVANTVLRVDHIIMAKAAGGPKPPKQRNPLEDDD